MHISAIVALSDNHVMGLNNALPWHLPEDLRHFKELTLNTSLIMGRKTHQSIGKALPYRENIVVTRDIHYIPYPGAQTAASLAAAFRQATHKTIMIIGGLDIFLQTLPKVETLYLTKIHATIQGDIIFPPLSPKVWQPVETTYHTSVYAPFYRFSFITLQRTH
jgi:dihydrofolate reductase